MGLSKKLLALPLAWIIALVICAALIALAPSFAFADEDELIKKKDSYQYLENGKPIKAKWKTVKGSRYYFDNKGNAVRGTSKKIGQSYYVFSNSGKLLKPKKSKVYQLEKGVYYVGPKGRPAASGWCIVKGKLYKVGKSGKCVTSKTVDGITFARDGAARDNTASRLKIAVMKKLDKLTKSGMSKKQKLRKCFNYCLTRKWKASAEPKDIGKAGWMQRCALKMITQEKGECFSFACAFAAFAYELGYKPVVRGVPKNHAYVIIEGKSYDNMGPRFGGALRNLGRSAKSYSFNSWGAPAKKKANADTGKRQGLRYEKNAYCYYEKGKRLKSKWKNVGSARYYFKSDGTAAVGAAKIKGTWYVFSSKGKLMQGKAGVVKVGGASYRVKEDGRAHAGWQGKRLYRENGQMATGVTYYKKKLLVFSKKGIYDEKTSILIQKQARVDENAAALLATLQRVEQPRKERIEPSCYSLRGMSGEDIVRKYSGCTLYFFKGEDGVTYFVAAE